MINRITNKFRHRFFLNLKPKSLCLSDRAVGQRYSVILLAAITWFASSPNAVAQYFNALPSCSEAAVHARIVKRFNQADRTLWYRGTALKYISHASERAYNIYPDSQINRRYCRGKAYMSNGKTRRVYFLIEQHMGLASFGWNVEYCLKGSDYWHAYGGWCRVLRKFR